MVHFSLIFLNNENYEVLLREVWGFLKKLVQYPLILSLHFLLQVIKYIFGMFYMVIVS